MQPAVVAVGVDDADGLQIGVDDGGTREGHTLLFQVLGNGVGQRAGGNGGVIFVDNFPACPAPNIGVKTAVFFLNVPEDAAVFDAGSDFQPVADDALVREQLGDLFLAVGADLVQVKAVVDLPESLPLVQHRLPAQPRLKGFQNQQLIQGVVIVARHTPLLIVIADVEGVGQIAPPAAGLGFFFCHFNVLFHSACHHTASFKS